MVKEVIGDIENEVVEQKEKLLLISWKMKENLDLMYQVKKSAFTLGKSINKRKSTKFLLILICLINLFVVGFIGYIKIRNISPFK